MEPLVARSTPEIVRLSVDLPTPFDPRTATISPALTIRPTPLRTSVSPYPAGRSPTASSGSASILRSQLCCRTATEVGLNDDMLCYKFCGPPLARGAPLAHHT